MSNEDPEQLSAQAEPPHSPPARSRGRGIAAVALVVVSVLAFAAAVPAMWARRTVLDTDRYVQIVSDVVEEPAVQQRLAERLTDATFQALDVEARLESVLSGVNSRLGFLAAPIAEGVHERVQARVEQLLASDRFQELWADVNRVAHSRIVAVLRGDAENVQIVDGTVTLNTLPLVNEVLKGLTELVSQLIGRPIELPEITATTVPSEALQRLEEVLGVDLPDDLGAIEVYDSSQLEAVQKAVNAFDRIGVLLVGLWILTFAGALIVSQRRRRTLLQLLVASAVMLVLERRFAIAMTDSLVNGMDPGAQAAGRAAADVVLDSLLWATGGLLVLTLVAIVVALFTGPYRWAVWTRRGVAEVARTSAGLVRGTEAGPTARWVAGRRDLLMLVGAVLFVAVLLVADVGVSGFLVLAGILLLYELAVWRTSAALAPSPPG